MLEPERRGQHGKQDDTASTVTALVMIAPTKPRVFVGRRYFYHV